MGGGSLGLTGPFCRWEAKVQQRGESYPRSHSECAEPPTLGALAHHTLTSHLEVPVYNAQVMQILDSIQHLEYKTAGIPLRVKAFFHNAVKQLPS